MAELEDYGRKFTAETLAILAATGRERLAFNQLKSHPEFVSGPLLWGVPVDPVPPAWTSDYWDYANLAEHILEDR